MRKSDFESHFRLVVRQHRLDKESINSVEELKLALERSFRRILAICHPDKFTASEDKLQADREFKKQNEIRDILFDEKHAEFLKISLYKWKNNTLFSSNEGVRADQNGSNSPEGGSNAPELTREENSFSRPIKETFVNQFLIVFGLINNQPSGSLPESNARSLGHGSEFSTEYNEFFNRIAWDFVNGTEENYNGFVEFLKKICNKPRNISSGDFTKVLSDRLKFLFVGLTSAKAVQESPIGFSRLAEVSELFSRLSFTQGDLNSQASTELTVAGGVVWRSDLWDLLVARLLNESIINAIDSTLLVSKYEKNGVSFYEPEFSGDLQLNFLKNCRSDLAITLLFTPCETGHSRQASACALGSLIAKLDNETAIGLVSAVKNFADHDSKNESKVLDMRMDSDFLVHVFAKIEYSKMTPEFKDLAVLTMYSIHDSMYPGFVNYVFGTVDENNFPDFLTLYRSDSVTLALANLTIEEMQEIQKLLPNEQHGSSYLLERLLSKIKDVKLQDGAYKEVTFVPDDIRYLTELLETKDRSDLAMKLVRFSRLRSSESIGNKFITTLAFAVRAKDIALLEHIAEIFITLDPGAQEHCRTQVDELIEANKVRDLPRLRKVLAETHFWSHAAPYGEYLKICAETGYRPLPDSFIAEPTQAIAEIRRLALTDRPAAAAGGVLVVDSNDAIKAIHESFKNEMKNCNDKKSTKEKFVSIVTQWINKVDCGTQSSVEQLINSIEHLHYIFSEIQESPVLKAETGRVAGFFGATGNTESYNKVMTQLKEKMKVLRENYVSRTEKIGRRSDLLEKIDRITAAPSSRLDGVVARFGK